MVIGLYRDMVEIQQPTRTGDGQGGYTTTWTKYADEWTKAERLSISRTLDQSGVKYSHAVRFRMRKGDHAIDESFRIVWDGNYTIHSVIPDHKGNEYVILAYR